MKLAIALILVASPGFAADNCGSYADMVAALAQKYGEYRVFQGPTESGQAVVEIFARPNGTWTALIVNPQGMACMVASGQTWIGFGVPQGEAG